MTTLFDIEPEATVEPVKLSFEGYALAYDVTLPKAKEVQWHLDVESIRETREQLRSYENDWCCDKDYYLVVRVKVEAAELEYVDNKDA